MLELNGDDLRREPIKVRKATPATWRIPVLNVALVLLHN
jgi:hypothetical protein